jgi:hypothetical protein
MKILDEFTSLPVSRQRKWQKRMGAECRCTECGIPAAGKLCDTHAIKRALSQLKLRGVTSVTRRGKWLVLAGLR